MKDRRWPGIVGTFPHQLSTVTVGSFLLLVIVTPVLHITSSAPVPELISLHAASSWDQQFEAPMFSASTVKTKQNHWEK